jgi:hypothetical protein
MALLERFHGLSTGVQAAVTAVVVFVPGLLLILAVRSSPGVALASAPEASATVAAVTTAQRDVVAPRPSPARAVPRRVPPGTWAKMPRPGTDIPDTPVNRLRYMEQVAKSVPGEPQIDKAAARVLIQKLGAELAKQGSIPPEAMKAEVGDGVVSIAIEKGTLARMEVRGAALHFPVCSEGLLESSMLLAETTREKFARAGARALLCHSDGCTAMVDLRPTTAGGGVYGGKSCIGLADMKKIVKDDP